MPGDVWGSPESKPVDLGPQSSFRVWDPVTLDGERPSLRKLCEEKRIVSVGPERLRIESSFRYLQRELGYIS